MPRVPPSVVSPIKTEFRASSARFPPKRPDSLFTSGLRTANHGCSLLAGRNGTFALEPKVIPLQEVIVRIVNPVRLLREMLQFRKKNYSKVPVYLTSFYREGIEQKNRFVSLTEGIFKIYKASSSTPEKTDQVKLLKMRRITNQAVKDTLIAKMKSGYSCQHRVRPNQKFAGFSASGLQRMCLCLHFQRPCCYR